MILEINLRTISKLLDIIRLSNKELKLLLGILILSSVLSLIPFYLLSSTSNLELLFMYGNLIIIITAGLAVVFSLILILRERKYTSELKKLVSLFLGIFLWFSGEIIYSYYQSVLRIDIPYPSYADSFYLLGYIFVGYYLYSSFYYWNKKNKLSKGSVFIITVFSALLIHFLVQTSIVNYSNNVSATLVDIVYHISDGIILIPALVILWNLRYKKIFYIHRSLISLSIILNIFANVGYFSTFNAGRDIFLEHAWIWNVLYCLAYILLAGALFWYNKLIQILNKKIGQSIILNKKKFKFLWEKQNVDETRENNSYSYLDKENIKDSINTLILNAKTEISLLIYIQNKYNRDFIKKNLNSLLTNFNVINNIKIQILFDNKFNFKLLLPKEPPDSDIRYVKIDKTLDSDMIVFIIDRQHMIFIHLKQDINVNSFLATYSTNSNIIHHFSFFFANLISLSELREQSTKI